MPSDFTTSLGELDPELAGLIDAELDRARHSLDCIASENFVPAAMMEVQGSILTNKYADGYPGRRDYDGCEVIDEIERLAIARATALFGAEHANVQPYSGSNANFAVLRALCAPGDTVLGWDFTHGGHPSHYDADTLTGRFYHGIAYHVRRSDRLVDMDEAAELARLHRPKVIFVGWSCYPRTVDYAAFRAIADQVGAYLVADMAHVAGIVAAKAHPNPASLADACTFTTHKTLGGARGGVILCRSELAERIDAAVYPGSQGGPLPHVFGAHALAFHLAMRPDFAGRIAQTLSGARTLAGVLAEAEAATRCSVLTGGTENHQVILDVSPSGMDGAAALARLEAIGINANAMPLAYDPVPGPIGSGIRLGTTALATRGLDDDAFAELGGLIAAALGSDGPSDAVKGRVAQLAASFPLYPALS